MVFVQASCTSALGAPRSADIDQAELREWRSTMAGRPPPMDPDHAYYTPADPLYADLDEVPGADELLASTGS